MHAPESAGVVSFVDDPVAGVVTETTGATWSMVSVLLPEVPGLPAASVCVAVNV